MIDAASYTVVETLRDGTKVEIRALKPTDRSGMVQAINRESQQSLYRRFFAIKRDFTKKEEDFFLNVDFVKHVALVAIVKENGVPTIVGGARYVCVQPRQAEVAFSIIDDYQGKGLGTLLFRNLAAIALGAGYDALVAEVLPENAPMLKVFQKCGYPMKKKQRDGTIHVTLNLKSN